MVADIGLSNYPVVDVRRTTSPNVVSSRRTKPVGACIHHTDGLDSLSWLTGGSARAGQPASADVLIAKTGKRYLITDDNEYSYGTGQIALTLQERYGQANPNEYFLSAELEYLAGQLPTYQQIDSLAEQVVFWARRWSWRWPYVLYGHYGIAAPIGRKSDPYLFDWGSFMGRLYVRSAAGMIAGL